MPNMSSSSTPKILFNLLFISENVLFCAIFCVIEVVEGILDPVIEVILYIEVCELSLVSTT